MNTGGWRDPDPQANRSEGRGGDVLTARQCFHLSRWAAAARRAAFFGILFINLIFGLASRLMERAPACPGPKPSPYQHPLCRTLRESL